MNVLFAEDYPALQELIAGLLQQYGHTVEVFNNGRDLLERIERDSGFDAVVTDHSMPFVTGIEVLRRIRCNARFNHLPVVVCSTHDVKEFKDGIEKEGGIFVWKSAHIDILSNELDAAVRSSV